MPSHHLDPGPCSPSGPLDGAIVPRRPYAAEVVAAVRALVEGSGLSYREAASRAGLREDTVGRWARRFGWRRAAGPARAGVAPSRHCEPTGPAVGRPDDRLGEATQAETSASAGVASSASPPRNDGSGTRRPYRYPAEVREAARVRIEGTREGLERIGLTLGIDRWTLHRWRKRFGWVRPAAPERPGARGFYRSRRLGRPYGGDAVGTARDLVLGSRLPLGRVAERAGVSRATLYRWIARRGWTRPATSRRFRPPYPSEVVAAARELYRTTELPLALVAARAGATPERVGHWARREGWTRPRDLPEPDGRVRRRRRPSRPRSASS